MMVFLSCGGPEEMLFRTAFIGEFYMEKMKISQ
jgi:hypothetical protein